MHHPIAQQEGVLKDGDLILFDLGYRSNGYCADISRTYPINGKFSDLQRKVYEAVLNTNKAVIEYVKPGLTIADLQAFAIENLKKESMRLGLIKNEEENTHDISLRERPLQEGNVITVEPGLYFAKYGIGVRIEDDVLVTETGSRNLSRGIKKEIDDVERLLKNRKY